ncbi:MAG: LemA family protein [Chthoniobacterales bacterium]|nr:LemA family protein [Chthoniobacterales bacterium]
MSTLLPVIAAGFFIVLVLLALVGVAIYNSLVKGRQSVRNGWAQIDVQLKRRHDLIPNLLNTVKGYATHEKETLENVISARSRATSAGTPGDAIKAEGELTQALGRLLAVSEAYPELKANTNFLQLQTELASTEDRIAFSRQAYNDAVTRYNTSTEVFPNVLLAAMLGFKSEPLFETAAAEKAVPEVRF